MIKIIYDNFPYHKDFITGWGFSCFIQFSQKNFLFDTGGDPYIFLHNLNKACINPEKIQTIIISHYHGDHTGGLPGLISLVKKADIYIGEQSYRHLDCSFKNLQVHLVKNEALEIYPGVFLTEELGYHIPEISLILNTSQGFVLITGCAHPGIINILQKAIKISQDKPFMILGGLHLLTKNKSEIKEIINTFKDYGLKYIAASHCTGDLAREMFRKEFKENFINAGAGKEIKLG